MSTLKVPGAQLSYEVEGSGPLLILIPGAAGVGEVFHQVARELSARYHVVTYDRRGFSRSQLDQLLSLSLEVQTIYALLQAFLRKPFSDSSTRYYSLLIHTALEYE
jgi:pimeloyl-ACP methyl ester carboxylesterase